MLNTSEQGPVLMEPVVGQAQVQGGEGGEQMSLQVYSDAFENGGIQARYGRFSGDAAEGIPQLSFPIRWEGVPADAKSLALVFIDYDNVIGEGIIWVHWLAANLPAASTGLPEDAARTDGKLLQGKNTWAIQLGTENPLCNRYGGPAPEDRPHEYELQLYALSEMLDLKSGFYYNEFLRESRGKILDTAILRGVYGTASDFPG